MNNYAALLSEALVGKQVAHNHQLPENLDKIQGEISKVGFKNNDLKIQLAWAYGLEKNKPGQARRTLSVNSQSLPMPTSLLIFEAATRNKLVQVPKDLFNFEVALYHRDNFLTRVRNLMESNGSIELRDPHSSSIFRFIHPGTIQFLDAQRLKREFEGRFSKE